MEPRVSFDPDDLDLDAVFEFLHRDAYWSQGRPRDVFDRAIVGSALVIGAVDEDGRTLGFARVVSDGATFAWLCDVFVLESTRGLGLGKLIVDAAVNHPSMACVNRYLLATADAHGLYAQFGFEPLDRPEHWMSRPRPRI